MSHYTRILEVYENERYQPTQGFSFKNLTFSDRKQFSNNNGKCNWIKLSDVSNDLISFGWKYIDNDWELDLSYNNNNDKEGWVYSTNFTNFEANSNSSKSLLHFVRRRKYIRKQMFFTNLEFNNNNNNNNICNICNNCDSIQIDRISNILLQGITLGYINNFNSNNNTNNIITEIQINLLKDKLMFYILKPLPKEYYDLTEDGKRPHNIISIPQLIDMRIQKFAEIIHNFNKDNNKDNNNNNNNNNSTDRPSFFKRFSSTNINNNSLINNKNDDENENEIEDRSHMIPTLAQLHIEEVEKLNNNKNNILSVDNILNGVSLLFNKDKMDSLVIYMNEINNLYFPRAERSLLAKMIICKLDIYGDYHCKRHNIEMDENEDTAINKLNNDNDNDEIKEMVHMEQIKMITGKYIENGIDHGDIPCIFSEIRCCNDGCTEIFSRKWLEYHDDICIYKIVPCLKICGDVCQRRLMTTHLEKFCILRPTDCPFKEYGCIADICVRDLPHHLDTCIQSHLMLTVNRIQEQQKVIISLNIKINDINHIVTEHDKLIKANTVAIAGTLTTIATQNDNINDIDNKLNKKIKELGNYYDGQIKDVKNNVNGINTTLTTISKLIKK